jgi:hypothetical protein
MMVKALQEAVEKVQHLPEAQQETLASIIEAELADEQKWEARFNATPQTLLKIAERAKKQYEQGLCDEL